MIYKIRIQEGHHRMVEMEVCLAWWMKTRKEWLSLMMDRVNWIEVVEIEEILWLKMIIVR